MVMDTVGEPHALEVTLESCELRGIFVVRIIEVQRLAGTADTEVVTAVLVEQDIASPQSRLTQTIHKLFLLQRQALKLRHIVTENLQVIELIHVVLERLLFLLTAAEYTRGCQNDKDLFSH